MRAPDAPAVGASSSARASHRLCGRCARALRMRQCDAQRKQCALRGTCRIDVRRCLGPDALSRMPRGSRALSAILHGTRRFVVRIGPELPRIHCV